MPADADSAGTRTGSGAAPGVDVGEWARVRARLFGTALAAGLPGGLLVVGVLALCFGNLSVGARKAFGVGALLLGLGVLGWSGSVFAGNGIEEMQRHLDTGTGWTESGSRRAMTRIAGFGLGVMVVAGVPSAV